MKKIVLLLIVTLVVGVLFPMTVLAHGHRGGNYYSNINYHSNINTNYGFCTVENCSIRYSHIHEQAWHKGCYAQGCVGYHSVCSGGWYQ